MNSLQRFAHRVPFARAIYQKCEAMVFPGSQEYWESRYVGGGNSGAGSYGDLAQFKAEVLNAFVLDQQIRSVIEFGCGDGNQLSIAEYPSYIGLDVSPAAIQLCMERFKDDPSKTFFCYDPDEFVDNVREYASDLAISLDVIYHLTEDHVYDLYMTNLFHAATRFVVIYSSNREGGETASHVRNRCFLDWVSERAPQWTLRQKIDNKFPFDPNRPDVTSISDFFIFEKTGLSAEQLADNG